MGWEDNYPRQNTWPTGVLEYYEQAGPLSTHVAVFYEGIAEPLTLPTYFNLLKRGACITPIKGFFSWDKLTAFTDAIGLF